MTIYPSHLGRFEFVVQHETISTRNPFSCPASGKIITVLTGVTMRVTRYIAHANHYTHNER